jgi:hypothetical protein
VDDVPVTIDRGWGTIALALGVAGMFLPIVGIPFALLARRLGNSDLKRIRAGELPWSASNLARAATFSGTLGIDFQIMWLLLLVIVWMAAMMWS